MKEKKEFRLKVITAGDGAVGKTSIVRRYLGWGFRNDYLPTIGANFYEREIEYKFEEGLFQLSWVVWDISGQPDFPEIQKSYYTGSHGAIMVYDISRKKTSAHIPNWVEQFYTATRGQPPLVLVGNKIDLRDTKREEVTLGKGEQLAEELSEQWGMEVPHIETSAKTKRGIDKAFKILSKKILERLGPSYV